MFDAHPAVQGSAPSESSVVETTTPQTTPPPATTPAPEAAPAPQAETIQSKVAKAQAAAVNPQTQPPAPNPFTPNFKFKVMNQEHEIDEFIRGAIKDPDTEKKVKELYEKAYGLDHVKPRLKEYQEKFKESDTVNKNLLSGIGELREMYGRNDLDGFFKKLQVPEEKILQWVLDKAKYNQLPPEQRQVLDAKRDAESRAVSLEKEKADYQRQLEEQSVQARTLTLQIELEKPETKTISEAFDARAGRAGAFKDAIVQVGQLAWYQSNGTVDLTPQQAMQKVLENWGNPVQPKEAPIIPPPRVESAQAAPSVPKPTLPNVKGRQTSSVAKSKPRSIADLKKLAAQFQQQ